MSFPRPEFNGRRYIFISLLSMGLWFSSAHAADSGISSPCDISYPSDQSIEWECHRLLKKESLESLFGDRWQDIARFNRIDRRHAIPGIKLKVPVKLEDIENFAPIPHELAYPSSDKDPKLILIDLTEQYLGAYERGRRVLSFPIASGKTDFITPPGEFRVSAYSRNHTSSLYKLKNKDIPYPMHYGLRFLENEDGVAYWIHGRDLPGYPASHGCVGLYDEEMQKESYGFPEYPLMNAAEKLYQWAVSPKHDDGRLHYIKQGPRVLILGEPPGGTVRTTNTAPGP